MKWPRLIVVLGVFAAVIMVILVSSALLLPRLVDGQLVRGKIISFLGEKTGGNLTLGKIALQWFPSPVVVFENAALSVGGTQGTIGSVKVYPSITHLLRGHVVVNRLQVQGARVKVRLPDPSETPFTLEGLERNLRAALTYVADELPALSIGLTEGWAEITLGDKAPLTLENLNAGALGSAQELTFWLSARSNLCAGLKLDGRISPGSLASRLVIAVQQLKFKESFAFLPVAFSEHARAGEASFELKVDSSDFKQFKADVDGSADTLVLARRGSSATVNVKRLQGNLDYQDGSIQASLKQLELAAPRLRASGELTLTPSLASVRVQVRDLDIAESRALALGAADDLAEVRKLFQVVHAGTISEMLFQSRAAAFAEMGLLKNLALTGVLRDSKIFIPGRDLELTNVNATLRLHNALLEAKELTANLGTTKGWDGTLKLGLEQSNAPFHLDMAVQANAADLRAALLKLVDEGTLRSQLLKVRDLRGELSGRLILGDTIDAISPIVAVSKADIRATYEPVPFPIAIRGARINYDQKAIRIENAQGSVGRSTFGDLGLTVLHDGSRQLKIDSGRVSLDLQETDTLLRGFKDLRSHFEKLQSAGGQIDLQSLTLAGAYDDPAKWTFAGTGTFNQVRIRHADFPGPVTLSRGKFDANQGRIRFYDTAATMSDASLIAGATFEFEKAAAVKIEMSGMGTIGGEMNQWMSRYVELPQELHLRSPLKITAKRFAWRAGGDVSFLGQVAIADGPQLTLDALKQPAGFALRNLMIDDGDRHARITFQLAKEKLDLSFSGELTPQTIDAIFASFPMRDSSLRGDIQVNATLADPVRFSAQGQLSGSNLLIPAGAEKIFLEKFSIEAGGGSVMVQSADLRLGKSRLTLSGKVTSAKEILRVDLDVAGERLEWEDLQRSFGGEGKPRQQKKAGVLSMPDVEGAIRLKTDHFAFEGLNVSRLETTAEISPLGISADINHGIACGIAITGRVIPVGDEIALDLQLTASEDQLEPAAVCLTNQQSDIKGIYSLRARLTGRGAPGHLAPTLKGQYEFSARDGEFVRSPGIDATFDYLNATGDFKVAFPDLQKETFPFRLVRVTGLIDGAILVADEVVIHSAQLNLSGYGKVDLVRKQIEGKALIAVLKPVEEVLGRIPVVGAILGSSLIGIPVRISGALDHPDVTYMAPSDVGVELLSIPVRILKIPFGVIKLFTPGGNFLEK